MNTMKNKQEILEAFRKNPDMMAILTIIRDLGLKDSWLAAGSVRNFIWNLLSDKSPFDRETDVDVIFFDPDVSYEETLAIENKLRADFPQYQWELKNQVYMHQHSPHTAPYTSSRDAMSKYPERCTAVGLRFRILYSLWTRGYFEFSSSSNSSFFRESRSNEALSNAFIQEKLAGEMEKFDF